MKKIIICILLFIVLAGIIIAAINFKFITNFVTIKFWEEMFKVRRHTEYGDVGRDTVYVLGNGKFQILNTAGKRGLIMYREDDLGTETLLRRVSKYKKVKGTLYIISDDGYGVVEGNTNQCKLYITVPKDEFIKSYGFDSEGQMHTVSAFVEDEHIQYLESFDDFSDNEKKVFDKLVT